MNTYVVYMFQGAETGKPYHSITFVEVIRAENKNDAFKSWCEMHHFDPSKYVKSKDNVWHNYYSVYVQDV